MFEYSVEEKKKEEAIQQIYRDFAIEYGKIQKSELTEREKKDKINELFENALNTENILINMNSLSELSKEDKEALGIKEQNEPTKVDTNLIDALVSIYAKRAKIESNRINGIGILDGITLRGNEKLEEIDTTSFEEELRQYFTEHYSDLFSNGYNYFLSAIVDETKREYKVHNFHEECKIKGELIKIVRKHDIDTKKFHNFGYQLTIQDGLIAEEDPFLGRINIFYATPEAINKRIYDLYSETLFREQKNEGRNVFCNDKRHLKNTYITYAEKNAIEIQDKDVLEEIPVDLNKVQGIATFLNRVLKEEEIISKDMTEEFAGEIQKEYSKIMNLDSFNFGDLESVKRLIGNRYISLSLNINEDSILKRDKYSPAIAYATPEYLKDEYKIVMEKIKELSYTDAYLDGYFEVEKANKQKEALRRYITENNIEGIDISIPKVEIDHKKTEVIAQAILNKYGEEYENKEELKARILKKVEDRYPEMFYERQAIDLRDLLGKELAERGKRDLLETTLYMQEDFVYMGYFGAYGGQCIYATPKSILEKIEVLDDKIATSDFTLDEKRMREELKQYAEENEFKIQIPSIESVENRRQREKDIFSFSGSGLGFFKKDILPDDPTARTEINFEDSIIETINKISEGVPGATIGAMVLMKDEVGPMLLLGLDDMNIRGSQIWEAYKNLYHENAHEFIKAVKNRDQKMVNFINEELASVGGEKAVTGGASFDRRKVPNKYRFTELEVEQLKEQRTKRIEKQKEARDKMIANSPAKKKSLGQKRRELREEKKKAYRERLMAMGKRSLGELEEELTQLQEKEAQAKQLCEQYEEKLPNNDQVL